MKKRQYTLIFSAITALMIVILIPILYYIYRYYCAQILDAQKDQLMYTAESVTNSMRVYLRETQDVAESLIRLDQFREAEQACVRGDREPMMRFLEQAFSGQEGVLCRMDYSPDQEEITCSVGDDGTYSVFRALGGDEIFHYLTIDKDDEGKFSFGVHQATDAGGCLILYVDAAVMYANTSEYLEMGDNGYVMIKDSRGIILMHKVEAQLGIDVLADRKKAYPDFDFSELEVLIEHQLRGDTAVETYNSYWWADENPRKARKVAAYMPLSLGRDFLVVSAVTDYEAVAGDIQGTGLRILLILVAIAVFVLLFLWYLRMIFRQQEAKENEILALKQQNEELEKRRQREEMEAHQQRLELIGTMTSGIAHEFNNLLTPIMGYSSLMLADMDESDENYEDMKEIVETSEKAREIISQINQFSSRRAEERMQPIHVSQAVNKALVITDTAKRRNIQLNTEVSEEEDICLGNPLQIQQIVLNLCNNAIQAIGEEKGTLTVRAGAVTREDLRDDRFPPETDAPTYRILVTDTGCGMSEETMSQIFVPFFTTKRPGEGTGLGLAVVARMIEAHSGQIRVHSIQGEGTTFCVDLPCVEPEDDAMVEEYDI